MRKLASIQRIWAIEPIKGADRIELARVFGWQCVVNKGQFQPKDLVVYFEVDSFLPIRPEFEFLRASCYKNSEILGEGFRLRTMKFRGQISQGLCLPVSIFEKEGLQDLPVGTDVSEMLGVRKWVIEERATTGGTIAGPLPIDVPHTDETRVQAEPSLINEFAGHEYYITTKMDGSSHSVSIDEDGFHVTGHNYEYKNDGSSAFYNFVNQYGIRAKMENYIRDNGLDKLTIQGEFCAPGIQRNRLKLTKPEWYVFTVRINGNRVGLTEMRKVCQAIGLAMVPVEEIGMDFQSKYPTVEAVLARTEGQYPNGGKKEGIVIRTVEPAYSETVGGPLSMKAVSNSYLLKNEE